MGAPLESTGKLELTGCIQNYHWGKLGLRSTVASLYKSISPEFIVDEKTPYAELWMGAHINCPAKLKGTGETLKDWISGHENCLGNGVLRLFGKKLPYLFKVLSIQKPLSIQVHPSKSHAQQLHKSHPDIYKDPNHKPEIAIALTPFEALCGFQPIEQIQKYIKDIPQLRALIGEKFVAALLDNKENAVRDCFHQLMTSPKEAVEKELESLINQSKFESGVADKQLKRLHKLYSEFPGDVGCFCIYFLNYITLQPGESIYLGPNVAHAYISGDCVECMACSDNVVRAGLTPKFRDVETLCAMLNYDCGPPSDKIFIPLKEDDFTTLYQPDIPDFAVANIKVPTGTDSYDLKPRNSACIILVVEGTGSLDQTAIKPGTILFFSAGEKCTVKCEKSLNIFQAFANV